MKKALGCSAQVVLLFVIAVLLAVPAACIATATAPMHSPELAEPFLCPPGTRLIAEWYQASWNHPGEKTLSVVCEDAQGKSLPTLPQDSNFWFGGLRVYFPYAFIPLLGIGVIVLAGLNALGFAVGRAWKKFTKGKQAYS
jgi:hypothetical protein